MHFKTSWIGVTVRSIVLYKKDRQTKSKKHKPMNQPIHALETDHSLKPKKMEISAHTYQKGWELAFAFMESTFKEKDVKRSKSSQIE